MAKTIYVDNAATTAMSDTAIAAMARYYMMLESRGYYVLFTLGKPAVRRRANSLIVRLASARSKINFVGLCAYTGGYFGARANQRLLCNLNRRSVPRA